MKLKHLSILSCLALLLCFCLGTGTAMADESDEPSGGDASFSMELPIYPYPPLPDDWSSRVDGWSGSVGSRDMPYDGSPDDMVRVLSYFDYSEEKNNYVLFNLDELVEAEAPAGVYKVSVCYSTGDPEGLFVVNIRGEEHVLPITKTVEGWSTFAPGIMSTYAYFDFSGKGQNDIKLYNGAATANPDIRSLIFDYVGDYASFYPTEAETAVLGGAASFQSVQNATGGKVVELASSDDTAAFSGSLGEDMYDGSYYLQTVYMNGGEDTTLTVSINGTEYTVDCPVTSDSWDTWQEGYAEIPVSLKGDGTDEILYSGGTGKVWLDSFMLAPAELVKDITEIAACDPVTVDFSTPIDQLVLPETVTVTLANGDTAELAVTWDATGYTVRKAGTYTLTGGVTLANGVTNSARLTASIDVTVRVNDDPDYETAALLLEAENADELCGTASPITLAGASGGRVLGALDYNDELSVAEQENYVIFNKSLRPLKKGTYKARITYTTGDSNAMFFFNVNGKEYPVFYKTTGPNAWSVFTPEVVYSDTFEIKGDGTDEIRMFNGVGRLSLFYDTIEFIEVKPEAPTTTTPTTPTTTDTPATEPTGGEEIPPTGVPFGTAALPLALLSGGAIAAVVWMKKSRRTETDSL